jgi:hypothetical protein
MGRLECSTPLRAGRMSEIEKNDSTHAKTGTHGVLDRK